MTRIEISVTHILICFQENIFSIMVNCCKFIHIFKWLVKVYIIENQHFCLYLSLNKHVHRTTKLPFSRAQEHNLLAPGNWTWVIFPTPSWEIIFEWKGQHLCSWELSIGFWSIINEILRIISQLRSFNAQNCTTLQTRNDRFNSFTVE